LATSDVVTAITTTTSGKIITGDRGGHVIIWKKKSAGVGVGYYTEEKKLPIHRNTVKGLAMVTYDTVASGGEAIKFLNVGTYKEVASVENAHEGYDGRREEEGRGRDRRKGRRAFEQRRSQRR
jgi:hypothetical protein